jgi:SM-20-related protein
MASLDFFRAAGLFLIEGVFPNEQCAAFSTEMSASRQSDAALERKGVQDLVVDPYARKTKVARVSKLTRFSVQDALNNLLPRLADHFQCPLTSIQPSVFLVYRPGDFFRRHADVSETEGRVLFLNDQLDDSGDESYSGGSLTFYGLQPPPFDKLGHPLKGKRGLLVGFQSNVVHEVLPVTRGNRYTVVTWCE